MMSFGPGFPIRNFEGLWTNIDLNQALEVLRIMSPSAISVLGLGLFKKRHGIAGFFYGLYYSTNFIPRMAADHYLSLMLRFVNGDHHKWMSIADLGKRCEGRAEIETAMRYLKYNGYIRIDKESKFSLFPNFAMTEKGLEHAQKVTKRFQHPEFALSYKPRRLERVASRINLMLGRKNIL